MLAAEPHRVTPTQAGVEQYRDPYPLPRAERPARAILRDVLVGPDRKALTGLEDRIFDACRRIRLNEARFLRPREQAAHGVENCAAAKYRHQSSTIRCTVQNKPMAAMAAEAGMTKR